MDESNNGFLSKNGHFAALSDQNILIRENNSEASNVYKRITFFCLPLLFLISRAFPQALKTKATSFLQFPLFSLTKLTRQKSKIDVKN
jgi:hypothetical protein